VSLRCSHDNTPDITNLAIVSMVEEQRTSAMGGASSAVYNKLHAGNINGISTMRLIVRYSIA